MEVCNCMYQTVFDRESNYFGHIHISKMICRYTDYSEEGEIPADTGRVYVYTADHDFLPG